MVAEIPLNWRIGQTGAEQTGAQVTNLKQRFSELQTQFKSGQISVSQYGREMRSLRRDAISMNSAQSTQKAIFAATHPQITQLSKAMGGLRSMLNSVTVGFSLLSISTGLLNQTNLASVESSANLREAQRELDKAIASGAPQEEIDRLRQKYDLTKELDDATKKMTSEQQIQNIIAFASQIGVLVAVVIQALPTLVKLPGVISLINAAILGTLPGVIALMVALWPLWLVLGAVAAILWLVLTPGDQVKEFFEWLTGMDLDGASQAIDDFFVKTIPNAFFYARDVIFSVWNTIYNGIKGIIDTIVNNVMGFVNSIINAVKTAIEWFSKMPTNIVGGVTSFVSNPIGTITGAAANTAKTTLASFLGTAPTKKAQTGFDGMVTQPTMFLAGENGPEHVSVRPGTTNGNGSNITIVVQGSIWSERELLSKVDTYLRTGLRRRGW